MQEKDKLLSTRILDHHGKIGPFFFNEFLIVFLACVSLFFIILLLSLFIEINSSLLLAMPSAFLLSIALIRFLIIQKVTSPYYINGTNLRILFIFSTSTSALFACSIIASIVTTCSEDLFLDKQIQFFCYY